jgi:hypothetical protein
MTNQPAKDTGFGGSWADYDNDGYLDLFIGANSANRLYHNNGDGTFTRLANFPVSAGTVSWSGSWGDYDRDGWVDLFISNGGGNNNFLLHNNRNGTFTRVTTAESSAMAARPLARPGRITIMMAGPICMSRTTAEIRFSIVTSATGPLRAS